MSLRTYYCPQCDGAGSIECNDSLVCGFRPDPQTAYDVTCGECYGDGFVQSDDPEFDATPYTPSRRRWRNWFGSQPYSPSTDLLARMGQARSTSAVMRFEQMYDWRRQAAMKPVRLPGGAA